MPMKWFSFETKRKGGWNKLKYKFNVDKAAVEDTSIGWPKVLRSGSIKTHSKTYSPKSWVFRGLTRDTWGHEDGVLTITEKALKEERYKLAHTLPWYAVLPQHTVFTHAEQMWYHVLGLPSLQNHAPNKHLLFISYPVCVVQVTDDAVVN